MGTIYITAEDAFIGKTDERLKVKQQKKTLLDVPMLKVEGVVVLGRATISPAVVVELLDRKIPLSFLTINGRYVGRLEPELTKNIFVRSAQWQAAGETDKALHVVRSFIRGKLKNYKSSLLRSQRDGVEGLQPGIDRLQSSIGAIAKTDSIDSLRGIEGAGSAAYFGHFDRLIRGQEFTFNGRQRRPPTDPVNALLSLGYTLLFHDLQSAVNIVGFDPYLGYLHAQHYGRAGLALDLMEEFRPLVVDATVLTAINKRILSPEHFIQESLSNAVTLTEEGLKIFLRQYEQKKQSKFKHPVMKTQCTYREAFEIQARLLAKYLMGETDKYPPLIR